MRVQTSRQASSCSRFSGLAITVLIGTAVLTAGCASGASSRKVERGSGTQAVSRTDVFSQALAFAQCMRTHGEPNFADPTRKGGSVQEAITPGSGVDPHSPQFTAARNACKHLLLNNGVPGPAPAPTFTASEQADYLKAASCMRSHGVRDFPDPSFEGNSVAFKSQTPIDTNTPQYAHALAACQKLIPAGLPYSSSGGP